MTRTGDEARPPRRRGDRDGVRRRVPGRPAVPGARALVGGLLMTVAAVGTFAAWDRAAAGDDPTYVVAARPLEPGEAVGPDDLRLASLGLHDDVAGAAFTDTEAVVGRVVLGPVGHGELLQGGQLADPGAGTARLETSFALPRERALDGRLRSGDRIDILSTEGDRTRVVTEQVPVVAVRDGDGSLRGSEVVLTIGLEDPSRRVDVVHALRAGEVTLVRSTAAGPGGAP